MTSQKQSKPHKPYSALITFTLNNKVQKQEIKYIILIIGGRSSRRGECQSLPKIPRRGI